VPAGSIPEDPDQRRQWLARWGKEQRERLSDRDPLRERLRLNMEKVLDGLFERLDPVLDRALDTSSDVFFPTSEQGGVVYVAGPSPWHVLPRALRKVGASEDDVFVEYGCGKGRVIHQAAKRPLKKVIGVEKIPEIADFARQLVAAQRRRYRCRDVEIVTGDAASFRAPDDVTLTYIADPQGAFRGETLDAILGDLIESIDRHPRRLRLIYNRGTAADEVLATGRFRRVPGLSFDRTEIFEST
jgi:SAM-dependent methyltransferase